MRGTQRGVRNPRTALGIIPAYAGNTPSSSPSSVPVGDHPRVCGEHPRNVSQSIRPWGSSPRMRGTRTVRHSQRSPIGIIPAYAGNTRWPCSFHRFCWDHPRVCGEHILNAYRVGRLRGSSPRMRGTRHRSELDISRRGIIPAYAGNTQTRPRITNSARDHPRVCGEHRNPASVVAVGTGSSPRMRGTHG